jgi:hypothetical protein
MVGATPTPTLGSPSSSSASSGAWLERFRVGSLPTIYYVPDFVSAAEEAALFQEVRSSCFSSSFRFPDGCDCFACLPA